MKETTGLPEVAEVAVAIVAELAALPVRDTPSVRQVRRRYSRAWRDRPATWVMAVAETLFHEHGCRWVAYELIAGHADAFGMLDLAQIEALGQGMADWSAVDTFGRIIAGPAWLRGQLADEDIARWAVSQDRWWRRAALVSTVALNTPSQGGHGDAARTLAICCALLADRDDMVVKAQSWALRKLSECDPEAVQAFVREHGGELAARARRETLHKLETGLKNPRRAP
jgi:3-methyladenine DNA glycosylase AlkD